MCGKETIAIEGYRYGKDLIKNDRALFEKARSEDRLFLFKYLYMLDRIFQAFCQIMKKYRDEENPILKAADRGAEGWMKSKIDEALSLWFIQGVLPNLQPPSIVKGELIPGRVEDLAKPPGKSKVETGAGGMVGFGGSRGSSSGTTGSRGGNKTNSPNWVNELPDHEYVREWRLPEGTAISDFFGKDHRSVNEKVPKCAHHKSKKLVPLCMRFQIENGPKCSRGMSCPLAHVKPSAMNTDTYKSVSKLLNEVFSGRKA